MWQNWMSMSEMAGITLFSYGKNGGLYWQIKETPVINYSAVKRIITSYQDHNPSPKEYNALDHNISL